MAENSNRQLHELTDDELLSSHKDLDVKVRTVLTVEGALSGRTTHGGTAPTELKKQFAELESQIKSAQLIIANEAKSFSKMMGE
jgi:argininosuccinate lyase